MIITDQFLLIHGLENEKQDLTTPQARETYYYKKLNYLKEHCDKHTLLIIDNFDAEDERTQGLLEGAYSVIFTTRISREKDGYQELSIHPMDNPEDLIALFQKFYKRPLQSGDDMILLQIFDKIARHTYGIELLARQMQAVLWSSIFVTLMANKIGGLQFGIYRNCQISSRVFHTAVAALPLTKANRSDFE